MLCKSSAFILITTCGLCDWVATDSSSLAAQKGPLSAAAGPNTSACHKDCLFFFLLKTPPDQWGGSSAILESHFSVGTWGEHLGLMQAGEERRACKGSERVIMKTWFLKRSRLGVLHYQVHSGREWSTQLTLFGPWPRGELGKRLKPGNGHSLSPDWNREFPVPGIFNGNK